MSSKRSEKETTETIRSGNNKDGLLVNLYLKLRSNPQTYIVEAVWAAEVSPIRVPLSLGKFVGTTTAQALWKLHSDRQQHNDRSHCLIH